ncbi:MAG: amino acid adenylation domain-containing protein [Nitrospira sp.]|nr:amino acid adenylation domain-containing protein [Nitrospira sp.]
MAVISQSLKNIEDIYPLSPMQEGVLFHTLLNPSSGVYLMQDRYLLDGKVDPLAFRQAWQQVVERHDVLRASFVWEDQKRPLQIVHKYADVPLVELDWRGWSTTQQDQELTKLLHEELRTGFNFAKAPLLRLRLIRLTEHTYHFTRSYHLILMDAWCFSIFMTDFFAFYSAQVHGSLVNSSKPQPYREYIAWLQKQDLAAAETFWRAYLKGFDTPTYLGVRAYGQQLIDDHTNIVDHVQSLSVETTRTLSVLAQHHQLTLNTFVQGAWALLLHHYSGVPEVLFGVTVAGRPPDLEGVEEIVGLFINTLPLRVSVAPEQGLINWLKTIFAQNVRMRQYEYTPLVQIQGWSDVPRGQSLFDSLFVFENAPVDPSLTQDALPFGIQAEGNRTHTNYPLTVVILPGERLGLQLTYNRRQFDDAAISRMVEQFRYLLEQMAQAPHSHLGDLTLLSPTEQQQVAVAWNQTAATFPSDANVAELFDAQATRTPKTVAVRCGEESITYAELNQRTEQVVQALVAEGVRPDKIVAVLMERGIDLVVLLLGIFKAGGGYLPLDLQHPEARWRQILTQGQVELLLTTEALQPCVTSKTWDGGLQVRTIESLMRGSAPRPRPMRQTHPSQLAYVIYTSGSTGIPKGAMVTQQGMVNNVWGKVPLLGLTATDVVAQTASHCFDISIWQLLSALLCGGRVEIIADEIVRDPPRLLATLARTGVTVAELVPSLLRELLAVEPPVALPTLRWLLPTGEAIPPELCRTWFAQYPAVPLLNAYGPAECADDVAYYKITAAPPTEEMVVPIGRPAANLQLYVLSQDLQPAPIGITGEICIGGVGVGRGYLQDPMRTAAIFVPHPHSQKPGERLYRTGDLGRYREDGNIEFAGRRDHQVKVRGFRIELGEIEARLVEQAQVREAVVVVREDGAGEKKLVGYVVPESGSTVMADDVRAHLTQSLPGYMVPSHVVLLDKLPLTPNGKVDRWRLPTPDLRRSEQGYVAPRTTKEMILTNIWEDVLGKHPVGIHDNFFELGGHSLLAAKLISRIQEMMKESLPLKALFEFPTITRFLEFMEEKSIARSFLVPLKKTGLLPPLYCIDPTGTMVSVYEPMAQALAEDQPAYGVELRNIFGLSSERTSIMTLAKEQALAIRHHQPKGPYYLIGWSLGGCLALAIAHFLEEQGQTIEFLGILDTQKSGVIQEQMTTPDLWTEILSYLPEENRQDFLSQSYEDRQSLKDRLLGLPWDQKIEQVIVWGQEREIFPTNISREALEETKFRYSLIKNVDDFFEACKGEFVKSSLHIWWASETLIQYDGRPPIDWQLYTQGAVCTTVIKGNHRTVVDSPLVHQQVSQVLIDLQPVGLRA